MLFLEILEKFGRKVPDRILTKGENINQSLQQFRLNKAKMEA